MHKSACKNGRQWLNLPDTGPVPVQYLGNRGSDRHEEHSIVHENRTGYRMVCGAGMARATCTREGTYAGKFTFRTDLGLNAIFGGLFDGAGSNNACWQKKGTASHGKIVNS